MSDEKPTQSDGGSDEGQRLWQLLHQDDGGDKTPSPRQPATVKPKEDESGSAPQPWQRQQTITEPTDSDRKDADPQEDVTRIERLLFDPEHADEIVSTPTIKDNDDDYDDAIRNFHRNASAAVTCKNHPEVSSVDQCPECQAYYCQDCLVVRRGRLLCSDCASSIYIPTEEEVLSASEQGTDVSTADVMEEEKPEFQVGSQLLGLEGCPAHPVKRLFAMLIDMVVTRAMVILLALLAGILLGSQQGEFFNLFSQAADGSIFIRIYRAIVLMQPVIPWVVVFAVVDFLYFFFTLSFFNRTLGMSWLSCRVVTEWGEFAGFSAIALRTLVMMICLGVPAILLAWLFPAYRGPHDYAAGTLVINYAGVKRVDSYETVRIRLM